MRKQFLSSYLRRWWWNGGRQKGLFISLTVFFFFFFFPLSWATRLRADGWSAGWNWKKWNILTSGRKELVWVDWQNDWCQSCICSLSCKWRQSVRACVRACVRARVCVCVCVCGCVWAQWLGVNVISDTEVKIAGFGSTPSSTKKKNNRASFDFCLSSLLLSSVSGISWYLHALGDIIYDVM